MSVAHPSGFKWRFHLFSSGSTCAVEAAPRVVPVQPCLGSDFAYAFKHRSPFFSSNALFGQSDSTLYGEGRAAIASRGRRAAPRSTFELAGRVARFPLYNSHSAANKMSLEIFVDESSARSTAIQARARDNRDESFKAFHGCSVRETKLRTCQRN